MKANAPLLFVIIQKMFIYYIVYKYFISLMHNNIDFRIITKIAVTLTLMLHTFPRYM